MTKNKIMCLAGKHPAQCGFRCSQCSMYDICTIDYCDSCSQPIDDWAEKYEDYHFPETGKDICKSCREKNMKESVSYAK